MCLSLKMAVTLSEIQTEDLLSGLPCSFGCGTVVNAKVKHIFLMLERNI
jgi:hypothetical protein